MGSRESKLGNIPNDDLTQGSLPSTPILTEKIIKNDDFLLDPRSPSANIARTPIGFLSSRLSSDLLSSAKILCDDPRSPTVEFTRTPIVVNVDSKLSKLQNKTLERVRSADVNIVSKTLNDTPIRRSPKLLESSPITRKSEINKRKSFVGLLETNVDYTETDLDAVQKEKQIVEELENSLDIVESENEPVIEEIIEKLVENVIKDEEETVENETNITPPSSPEIVEEILPLKEASPPQNIVNITADVKDFDKKLTNLIYEDNDSIKDLIQVPKMNILKETNRTPLATRNSRNEPKKSAQKLKVSDQPRKSFDGAVSRIPVLKEKRVKKLIQCENTPPRNFNKAGLKAKKSQWDADKTLVI